MNIKDFILGYVIGKNDGGGGSSVEIEPLEVTENGEYSEEGVAYSPVTVNVSGGGGASNVVFGSFEGQEAGALSVDTGYSGNGYPIALYIWITDGPYNTNGAGYATGLSYVPFLYYIVKMLPSDAPTWTDMSDRDNGLTNMVYRTSGATVSQGSLSNSTKYMATGIPSDYNEKTVVVINDASHFKVVVKARNNSGYGFPVGVNYKYCVVYSE